MINDQSGVNFPRKSLLFLRKVSFRGRSDLEVSRSNSCLTSSNSRLKLKFHGHCLANVVPQKVTLGPLSTHPNFEAFTSTGSEVFSFSSLDVIKYLQLSFFSLIQSICLKIWAKALPKNAESLPVDMRCCNAFAKAPYYWNTRLRSA